MGLLGTRNVVLVFPETLLQPPSGVARGLSWLVDVFIERFGPGTCIFCASSQVILRPPHSIPILVCQMRKRRHKAK